MSIDMRFQKLLFTSLFFLCWHSLLAQSTNGKISGLILDPTGGVIAGADLLVIDDVTGVKTTSTTNSEGIYVFPNLPPGPYRLQVSKAGFKTLIKPDIVLNVQGALSINFTLPIGAVSDSVTVQGGASLLNTTDGSISTVVDQSYVSNMPLNGRSFQDLILLTPGVVSQTPQNNGNSAIGTTGEFSVNGQRAESNYYTVDGVSANVGVSSGNVTFRAGPSGSTAAATALGTTQALVSVEALQEFRVQSSSYSAEYGRNPGGQFAFETKSGTNELHGTAYDYLRNGVFDAQDWFNDYFGKEQPALRQNDFGVTLGGPIEIPRLYDGRDKTFFFVSYEGLRLSAPQAAIASPVPDLCMRGLGSCPSGRAPAANVLLPILGTFPLPSPGGIEDAKNGVGQFIGSWSNPSTLDSTSLRFDHAITDKFRLFFRFGDTSSGTSMRRPAATAPPTLVTENDYILRTYTAGVTSLFSNHLSNDLRMNYTSNHVTSSDRIDPLEGSEPLDLLEATGIPSDSESLFLFTLGASRLVVDQGVSVGTQSQWNVVDSTNIALGRHQIKFGLDWRRLAPSRVGPSLLAEYFFLNESSVEANKAGSSFMARQIPSHPLFVNFSAFVQDEWKASQRLNLSLGLRWDVNPAPSAAGGLRAYAIQGTGPDNYALAPQGTPLWETTWRNFAPRAGIAYALRRAPDYETVVRAGTGVFFDTGQQLGLMAFDGPGFVASATPPVSFPGNPAALAPAITNPPTSRFSVIQVPVRNLQVPYTVQWNASVQQAIGAAQTLTVSYVGAHAVRLLLLNQLQSSVNPLSSLFRIAQNGLTSDYDSLQIEFQRRLTNGMTALASYAWSHCLDFGSEDYTFGYQRGNCDFDVRHNLTAAVSYDLPNVGGRALEKILLHDWGIDDRVSVRSAFPVTLDGNPLLQPDGSVLHGGLNLVPGQSIYLYGNNCDSTLQALHDLNPGQKCPAGRAINPLAFASVSSGLGDAPRNFVEGFGAWQMNLALRREFPIHERLRLHFRAEAFNVFNHPNFGTINSAFGQPTFGQATATLANSLGILNPLYQSGGPRSMQFAVKLSF